MNILGDCITNYEKNDILSPKESSQKNTAIADPFLNIPPTKRLAGTILGTLAAHDESRTFQRSFVSKFRRKFLHSL